MQDETPPTVATALAHVHILCTRLEALQRDAELVKMEIREAWRAVPHMPVRRERPCRLCLRPTLDMFGDSPQCKRHPIAKVGGVPIYDEKMA